jgi:aerobic carbon-monoxide dehydrogenase large subunit
MAGSTALDAAASRGPPQGVVAVFTAADLESKLDNTIRLRDGQEPRRHAAPPPRAARSSPTTHVRYAGEAVAVIVAETRAAGARRGRPDRVRRPRILPVHVETAPGGEAIHPKAPEQPRL